MHARYRYMRFVFFRSLSGFGVYLLQLTLLKCRYIRCALTTGAEQLATADLPDPHAVRARTPCARRELIIYSRLQMNVAVPRHGRRP